MTYSVALVAVLAFHRPAVFWRGGSWPTAPGPWPGLRPGSGCWSRSPSRLGSWSKWSWPSPRGTAPWSCATGGRDGRGRVVDAILDSASGTRKGAGSFLLLGLGERHP